jgi:SAM-dependent methyltransferase
LLRSLLRKVPFLRSAVQRRRRQKERLATRDAWAKYSADHDVPKLNVGSGVDVLSGWFNVDFQPFYKGQNFMDATAPFPFPDQSFDFVRSEHMIEHIPYLDGILMLQECHRVMRPGGIIRIATPDLKKLAKLYEAPLSKEQRFYVDAIFSEWRGDYQSTEVGVVINNIFSFDHRFIYDSGTLGEALRKTGFGNLVQTPVGHSEHPELAGIDGHMADDDYIAFETLTMEAQKL